MSRFRCFRRKTAPGVRDGRALRKNNWRRSPCLYTDPQPRLAIDRRRPGAGYRHLLLKRDIERFVTLIPNWETASVGLSAIVLDEGRYCRDGWYYNGVIGIRAWSTEMRFEPHREWYLGHRDFLRRIEARVYGDDPDTVEIHWTPWTARAYQLCHVFLHELDHHRDRMDDAAPAVGALAPAARGSPSGMRGSSSRRSGSATSKSSACRSEKRQSSHEYGYFGSSRSIACFVT